MSEPVSWLMIEPGWSVQSSDGDRVGEVYEVTGAPDDDIFDGIVFRSSALGVRRYAPADKVGTIADGVVHLTIDHDAAERLDDSAEPGER